MKPSSELLNLLPGEVDDRYDPDLEGDFILAYSEDEDWYVGLD